MKLSEIISKHKFNLFIEDLDTLIGEYTREYLEECIQDNIREIDQELIRTQELLAEVKEENLELIKKIAFLETSLDIIQKKI